MEVAPRYKLLSLITLFPLLALLKLIIYCLNSFGAKELLCLYIMWLMLYCFMGF